MRRRTRAYTLAEMMTVVGIIGMIAVMAVPQYVGATRRAREDALRSNLALVRAAVDAFRGDTGLFPNALTDLTATSAPANGRNESGTSIAITSGDWRGPYLRTLPTDPVSGVALNYSVSSPTVGRVTSSATGNDSRGVAFSAY